MFCLIGFFFLLYEGNLVLWVYPKSNKVLQIVFVTETTDSLQTSNGDESSFDTLCTWEMERTGWRRYWIRRSEFVYYKLVSLCCELGHLILQNKPSEVLNNLHKYGTSLYIKKHGRNFPITTFFLKSFCHICCFAAVEEFGLVKIAVVI